MPRREPKVAAGAKSSPSGSGPGHPLTASGDASHVRWPRPTRIKNQPLPTQYSRSIGSLTKENLDAREDAIACGRAQRVRVCTEAGEPIGLMGMGELSGRGALHFLVISWLAMFCDLTIGVDLLRQRNALAEIIGARLLGLQGHSFSRRIALPDTTVHYGASVRRYGRLSKHPLWSWRWKHVSAQTSQR